MTSGQKVIKGLGIALAVFLVINIASVFLFGVSSLFHVLGFFDFSDSTILEKNQELEVDTTREVSILDIDLSYTKLVLKEGESLKAETNNASIKTRQNGNKLLIEEKSHHLFKNYNNLELIVTIPKDMLFDEVKIEAGAGSIHMDTLKARKLSFDFGAGYASIDSLEVFEKAEIEGGAGEIKISGGKLHNLDLDMGVGKFSLTSLLTGKTQIDAGVGEMNITVLNSKENYTLEVDKGIGSVFVNGVSVSSGKITGSTANTINVDGGVGKISMLFQEDSQEKNEVVYQAELEIKEYFTSETGELVILGILQKGSFKNLDTVSLVNEKGEVLKTTTILDKKVDFSSTTLETSKVLDSVFFTLKDITESELKEGKKVVIQLQ